MALPLAPPLKPMLAKKKDAIPTGDGWLYEPKWDGFRCVVFRDGDDLDLQSRNQRPLARYFPELLDPLRAALADRCVVDGEVVIMGDDGLEFDWLQQRIHPAESRIDRLAAETPASFVAFDLVALGDDSLVDVDFAERRRLLVESVTPSGWVHVTPITDDPDVAQDWFERFEGAGLDGVIAKTSDLAYLADKRAMVKVKKQRTADCVVAGFRWHKSGDGVGSFLLGLYDDGGGLHHVGVAASFTAKRRAELVDEIDGLRAEALDDHPWKDWADYAAQARVDGERMPGGLSRWNDDKDLSWVPLRPERVIEVAYDYMQGSRFRTVARMKAWRPDKDPAECTYAQLEVTPPVELTQVLRS